MLRIWCSGPFFHCKKTTQHYGSTKKLFKKVKEKKKKRTFANRIKKKRLLVFSERWTDHPRAQTSAPLEVFRTSWIVRSRKCNQLLRLNFGGVKKKISLQSWETESEPPQKKRICNKGKEWTRQILKQWYYVQLLRLKYLSALFSDAEKWINCN